MITDFQMLKTGKNLHGRTLTDRQRAALEKRQAKVQKPGVRHACAGCYSGIVAWNQGSSLCNRCLRNDRG